MKIAYLSTFYPYRGGIAQFNASVYKAFEQNHNIKAYTFTLQYPKLLFPGKTQFVTPDDNVIPIEAERLLSTINPFSYITTARKIAAFEPDIMIMKFWTSFLSPSLGYVAGKLKANGAKVISVLDNVIPHEKRFIDNTLTQYFLKRNSGFIVMSDTVKQDLLSLKPDAKYVHLQHPLYNHFGNPIYKPEAKEQLGLNKDKKTLLFFGLIRDYKGLDLLIDAFGNLSNDYQLLIAGEPYGDFTKYIEQINKLQNKENTKTEARYISDSEVPLFFSAADACVLPYRSATQSGITSIAYHFNLPIIATDVGGLKESIKDGETGIIVAEPTVNDIISGIQRFFVHNNQEKFTEGIEALKQNLSWERFADSVIHFSTSI